MISTPELLPSFSSNITPSKVWIGGVVLYSWPVGFELCISPCYDPFQLLDTFMADSDYSFALSLTIYEPCVDPQSNTVSWPVIH